MSFLGVRHPYPEQLQECQTCKEPLGEANLLSSHRDVVKFSSDDVVPCHPVCSTRRGHCQVIKFQNRKAP